MTTAAVDSEFRESVPRIVRILARKFAKTHEEEEDFVQEGALAYIKAAQTYRPDAGARFDTYASRVISNRLIDLTRKSRQSSPIDEEFADEDYFDDALDLSEIKKILAERVGEIDRAIFNSYIEGFSYDEMGKIFDLGRKKIDNTVQKVKKIIKDKICKQ